MNAEDLLGSAVKGGIKSLGDMIGSLFSSSDVTGAVEGATAKTKGAIDKWSGLAMGMIGVGMAAVSSLFKDMDAKVESMADKAKSGVEDTAKTRGLIAGDQSIQLKGLTGDLTQAMRPTNEILMRIEKKLGAAPTTNTVYNNSTGYSVTTEVIGAGR